MKNRIKLSFTVLALALGSATAMGASSDISVFNQYVGDYVLDPSQVCNEAYGEFTLSLDHQKNAVVLVFSGNNTAGIPIPNGVPQYTPVSLTDFTDLPRFPIGERRERTVIEGNAIVDQIQETTFSIWGFWRDNDTQMSFANGNSVTLSFFSDPCKFIRKP